MITRITNWFATDFGLAKFDNINWTVYDTTNSNIKDEVIISFTSDNKNNLWQELFLSYFYHNNNEYTYYINDAIEPSKPYNTTNSVKVDQYDNKWLGTYNGLYKFNEKNKIIKQIKKRKAFNEKQIH